MTLVLRKTLGPFICIDLLGHRRGKGGTVSNCLNSSHYNHIDTIMAAMNYDSILIFFYLYLITKNISAAPSRLKTQSLETIFKSKFI